MSEGLNLFSGDDSQDETDHRKTAKDHIAAARHELSDEAKQKRAEQRRISQQRAAEAAERRRLEVERAAEQGVDIRTSAEIDRDIRKQRSKDIEALREKLRKNTP